MAFPEVEFYRLSSSRASVRGTGTPNNSDLIRTILSLMFVQNIVTRQGSISDPKNSSKEHSYKRPHTESENAVLPLTAGSKGKTESRDQGF